LRLWLLLAAGILLVLVLMVAHRLTRGGSGAVQVQVLVPQVQGLAPGETARLTSDLDRSLRQALREIDGVTLLDPPQSAEEQIAATAYCGPRVCQVVLRRLDARDGSELWTERLQVPVSRPVDLAVEMEARLRRAWPAGKP
jgi:hypothetical protein